MSNRIDRCFEQLRAQRQTAFIPYICAGDPTLDATRRIAAALEEAGADLLELGLPFSDPLADGIANQLAAQRALAAGSTTRGVLDCVRSIRRQSEIPIVLYTYLNPILQFGWAEFHRAATEAGADALLILDLPPDEETDQSATDSLFHIRLIAPTTPEARIATIAASARGFIYYVSREGVTGARATVESFVAERVRLIRSHTKLPIAVGFGISTAPQAAEVARIADAVVVGSAIVERIAETSDSMGLEEGVRSFVRPLAAATKQPGGMK